MRLLKIKCFCIITFKFQCKILVGKIVTNGKRCHKFTNIFPIRIIALYSIPINSYLTNLCKIFDGFVLHMPMGSLCFFIACQMKSQHKMQIINGIRPMNTFHEELQSGTGKPECKAQGSGNSYISYLMPLELQFQITVF